jgi:CheY-like chemotaxis protein
VIPSKGAILLAEDNPDDVLLIQRAFHKAGVVSPLHVVPNGEEAVAYLSGQGACADRGSHPLPALLLLDLKMPLRTGFEVLEWLASRPALRHLRVVVLTTSKHRSDVERAYALGAHSYLVKPVDFDSLRRMIETLNLFWMVLNEKPAPLDPGRAG